MVLHYTKSIKTTQHQDIDMITLDELKHYFRHQSTATEDFTPPENYEYQTINQQIKVTGFVHKDNLASLLEMLNAVGFVFEGYRDRAPYFVKPDPDPL